MIRSAAMSSSRGGHVVLAEADLAPRQVGPGLEGRADLVTRVARPQVRVERALPGVQRALLDGDRPGRAGRSAVVTGGWLDEHPVHGGQRREGLVGLAVEEGTAGQAQRPLARALQPVPNERDEQLGQAVLQRGGEVGLVALDRPVGRVRGEGLLREQRAGVRVALLGVGERALRPVDDDRAAIGVEAGELAEDRAEPLGVAVRG